MKDKKLKLIAGIVLVSFIFLITALNTNAAIADNILGYYTYDTVDISGTNVFNKVTGLNNNGTVVNAVANVAGKINQAYKYDGDTDYINYSAFGIHWTNHNWTLIVWANYTGTNDGTYRGIIGNRFPGTPSNWFSFGKGGTTESNQMILEYIDSGGDKRQSLGFSPVGLDYQMYTIVKLNSNLYVYLNNTIVVNLTGITGLNIGTNTAELRTGQWFAVTTGWIGNIDEVAVFNRSLSQSEISGIYNTNIGLQYPFGVVGDTLNITSTSPANATQFNNAALKLNVTFSNSETPVNCSLVLNGTLNQTVQDTTNGTATISFNKTLTDGKYVYFFSCTNPSTTENSTTNTFFIDTVNPTSATNFVNNTIYFLNNIVGQFNITDEQILYSFNLTVTNGSRIYIIENKTDINTQKYGINFTLIQNQFNTGNHNLTLTYSDGHTKNEIDNFEQVNINLVEGSITYKDGSFIKIDPTTSGEITTIKEIDRYTFDYTPTEKLESYEFKITADEPIHLVEAEWTPYKKWFISGGKWLDFYLKDYPEVIPQFTKIDDYNYLVTINNKDINLDKFSFNSIGQLNTVTQVYYFQTTNASATYQTTLAEGTYQSLLLQINKTSLITYTNANLTWNRTYYAPTKTITANYDLYNVSILVPYVSSDQTINFNWTYFINSSANSETGVLNFTQTILNTELDNCSSGNVTINISTYLANNYTLLNTNVDLWLNYTINNATTRLDFNRALTGANNYLICLNPPNATLYGNLLLDYQASGYAKGNYWLKNINLTGNSQYKINLYSTDSTNSTRVNLFLNDENDNVLSNWLIKINKYDITTGQYYTQEIIQTDVNGQAQTNLILYTQRYQFVIIDQSGNIRKTVEQEEIYITDIFLRVNLQQNTAGVITDLNGVSATITFDNSTGTFSFTYSDLSNTITSACLDINKLTVYGITDINNTCITGTNGTITYSIGTNQSGEYVATGIGYTTGQTVNSYTLATLNINIVSDANNWGLMGIFLTAFICVTLFFAGVWNPAVAIGLTLGGFIFSWAIGLITITIASVFIISAVAGIIIFKLRT